MGVNKIGALIIPDYYVKVDYAEFADSDWRDEVTPMVAAGIPCLLWEKFDVDAPNVTRVARCEHHGVPAAHPKHTRGWHEPICTAYNSISIMAQWAVKLGFDEIVLVGCDLNFTDGVTDHFMPYHSRVDAGYVERNNSCALAAHALIQQACPIPVFDATPSGILNYPVMEL